MDFNHGKLLHATFLLLCFFVSSTAILAYFYHQFPHGTSGLTFFSFPSLYLHDYEIQKLNIRPIEPPDERAFAYVIIKSFEQSHDIVLLNTCREIEGKFIDYVSTLGKKELITIGQLTGEGIAVEDDQWITIKSWLDKLDKLSCVFASFGSECFFTKQEIEEIAKGLELSKVNFIWSIKFPTSDHVNTTIEEKVPKGFLERTEGRGMVTKGWVPQSQILNHSSVGGFVTHCGWNSMLESMSYGVPIIPMPMNHDQPLNSRLVEELGIGVEILRGENGEIKSEELAKGISKAVEEKTSKGEVNLKAKEMSEKIKVQGDNVIDEGMKKLLKILRLENLNSQL